MCHVLLQGLDLRYTDSVPLSADVVAGAIDLQAHFEGRADASTALAVSVPVTTVRPGRANAIVYWFRVHGGGGGGVCASTGPDRADAHWSTAAALLAHQVDVVPGVVLTVRVKVDGDGVSVLPT